jgi:Mg2+ and Co2+ transporter CorA
VLRLLPAGSCSSGATWIDAVDPDDEELETAAQQLGCADAVVQWLRATDRPGRPHAVDGSISFVLPVAEATDGTDAAEDDPTIAVVVTAHGTLTVHHGDLAPTIDVVARTLSDAGRERTSIAPVLGLIDQAVDRYELAVDHLTRQQAAHGTEVLRVARGTESPTAIVADSLALATQVDRVSGRLRRLRQVVIGLRHAVVTDDGPPAIAESLDASERAVSALQADLGDLNHRLEVMTDARMSLQSARQSDINKAIGAWAGVFAVNAVITGWYGMNIEGLPGAGSWVTVAIIMACATVFLIVLFRRIDWL